MRFTMYVENQVLDVIKEKNTILKLTLCAKEILLHIVNCNNRIEIKLIVENV